MITTHTTFISADFQATLARLNSPSLIIADEAHHLGAERSRQSYPQQIPYRLALSATPDRWFDDEGTAILRGYFGEGVVTTPVLDVTGDLIELNDLFNLYWRKVVPLGQTSSIAFPFSRLHNEPFWKLVAKPNHNISDAVITRTSTVSYLRTYALGARIDENLFAIMQTEPGRTALREALLQSCFSVEAQQVLREQSAINQGAFDYERLLQQQSHQPLVKEVLAADSYKPAARDQGFRRIVVNTYDHRCALCGIRIVTPEGHTVVEAAHIVPWCESRNDDVRNGMALCRLCHWGFDEGMLGVSNNYQVIISTSIGLTPNFAGPLQTLTGRGIIPPQDSALWPAQEYLGEHRHRWKLK